MVVQTRTRLGTYRASSCCMKSDISELNKTKSTHKTSLNFPMYSLVGKLAIELLAIATYNLALETNPDIIKFMYQPDLSTSINIINIINTHKNLLWKRRVSVQPAVPWSHLAALLRAKRKKWRRSYGSEAMPIQWEGNHLTNPHHWMPPFFLCGKTCHSNVTTAKRSQHLEAAFCFKTLGLWP